MKTKIKKAKKAMTEKKMDRETKSEVVNATIIGAVHNLYNAITVDQEWWKTKGKVQKKCRKVLKLLRSHEIKEAQKELSTIYQFPGGVETKCQPDSSQDQKS
jgi:hypothetical protein